MNTDSLTHDLISLSLNELDAARSAELRAMIERDGTVAAKFSRIQSLLATMNQGVLLQPPAATVAKALAIVGGPATARPLAWLDAAAAAVAQVLRDSLGAAPLAGFRGEAEGRHLSCSSGTAQIDLLMDEDFDTQTEQPGIVVHGQIAGVSAGEVAACVPGTVNPLSSADVASNGTFTLRIGASESDLVIQTQTGIIRVNGIKVR
ncbi:MAG: hypothetical protein NTV94_18575 [Planctomycetota bacterium]|nr:hypothetical protein [Planctomycetota bacterium]